MKKTKIKITLYNVNKSSLKSFVDKIESVKTNWMSIISKQRVDETLNYIKQRIFSMFDSASTSLENRPATSCSFVACGSSSSCYVSTLDNEEKHLFKIFEPYGFYSGDLDRSDSFVWIKDSAPIWIKEEFLKKFIRFITQGQVNEEFTDSANKNRSNPFMEAKLFLSSEGFCWRVKKYFGQDLEEAFSVAPKSLGEIINKINLVILAAKGISLLHSKQIFHGDIKPANFFAIDEEGKEIAVRNIDFDTCTHFEDVQMGCFENFAATTAMFYSLNKELTFDDFASLAHYDVVALAKMLLYAFVGGKNINDELDRWLFYNKGKTKTVYYKFRDILLSNEHDGAKEKQAVYILKKLKCFFYDMLESETNLTTDCFISQLENILLLFKKLNSEPVAITSDVLRLCAMNQFDKLYQDVELDRSLAVTIKQKIFESNTENPFSIDKHLLPDIVVKGKTLSYSANSVPPLQQAIEICEDNLFLTAQGGIGKTTSLRAFWLDFLAGNHEYPCIYVDLKMVDPNAGECQPIEKYIKDWYEVRLHDENLFAAMPKPIILLDGVNEMPSQFLKSKEGEICDFVKECNDLIGRSYRLVIGSRSIEIRGLDLTVYCELQELNDNQIATLLMAYAIPKNSSLRKLLRNNFILSLYLQMRETKIISEDITAGSLLHEYFEQCFKRKFIKNNIDSFRQISRDEFNKIYKKYLEDNSEDCSDYYEIDEWAIKYDNAIKSLIDSAFDGFFSFERKNFRFFEFNQILSEYVLDIGVVRRLQYRAETEGLDYHPRPKYTFMHEIYQEYFQARQLFQKLSKFITYNDDEFELLMQTIEENERFPAQIERKIKEKKLFQLYKDLFDLYADFMMLDHYLDQKNGHYNFVVQMTGEMLGSELSANQYIYIYESMRRVIIPQNDHTCWNVLAIGYFSRDCDDIYEIIEKNTSEHYKKTHRVITTVMDGFEYYGLEDEPYLSLVKVVNGELIRDCQIPERTRTILKHSLIFEDCSNFCTLSIPKTVVGIDEDAILGSQWENIEIDEENEYYYIKNRCLVDKRNNTLICCSSHVCINNDSSSPDKYLIIEVPENIKRIGSRAFLGATSIKEIKVSNNVTHIYHNAFEKCSNMSKITIPNGVKYIGHDAFAHCYSLEYETYDNAQYLGNEQNPYLILVRACNQNIETCIIHEDAKIICGGAFSGCLMLTDIRIPDGLLFVGRDAFSWCSKLSYNTYGNSRYLGSLNNPYHILIGYDLEAKKGYVEREGDIIFSLFKPSNKICYINEGTKIVLFDNFDTLGQLGINLPNSIASLPNGYACEVFQDVVINFNGTIEQWEAIIKDEDWRENLSVKVVNCLDGTLEF